MKKFTKQITSLLAVVTAGSMTSAPIHAVSDADVTEMPKPAGMMVEPDYTTETEPPIMGDMAYDYTYTTDTDCFDCTTAPDFVEATIGTSAYTEYTEEESNYPVGTYAFTEETTIESIPTPTIGTSAWTEPAVTTAPVFTTTTVGTFAYTEPAVTTSPETEIWIEPMTTTTVVGSSVTCGEHGHGTVTNENEVVNRDFFVSNEKPFYAVGEELDLSRAYAYASITYANGLHGDILYHTPITDERFVVDASEFDNSTVGIYNIYVNWEYNGSVYTASFEVEVIDEIPTAGIMMPEPILETGDIDGNGNADMNDLTDFSLYLLKDRVFTEPQVKAADINRDGNTNLADLPEFKKMIVSPDYKQKLLGK